MVGLASGQQTATFLGLAPLTPEQILGGAGTGAVLSALTDDEKAVLSTRTPLWFYILREAEQNNVRLTGRPADAAPTPTPAPTPAV